MSPITDPAMWVLEFLMLLGGRQSPVVGGAQGPVYLDPCSVSLPFTSDVQWPIACVQTCRWMGANVACYWVLWGECGLWDRTGTLGGVCIGFSQLPSDILAVACFLLCTKERDYCKVPQGYHVSSLLLCDKLPDGLGSRNGLDGWSSSGAYRRLQSAEGVARSGDLLPL